MKRDMELLRSILLRLEADNSFGKPEDYGVDVGTFCEHVRLLDECGLIDGVEFSEFTLPEKPPTFHIMRWPRLTWEGHEFLAAARDPGIWAKATGKIAEATGTVSISVLIAVCLVEN